MQLLASQDLFSFFYDRVQEAQKIHGTEVEEDTEFYLVNLLVDFLQTRRLLEVRGQRVDELPLAVRLLECRAGARSRDRFLHLKHLADSTLYVLGFFSESLRRSNMNLSYYAGMGESAYRDLSTMSGWGRAESVGSIFGGLAERFRDCVELLGSVREGVPDDRDIVALYEHYVATGDEQVATKLRALGILVESSGQVH